MFQSILPSSATPFLHYQPSINYQPFTGSVLPNCSSRIFITELSTTEFLIRFPPILSLINELKLSIESSKGIYPTSIPSSPIIPPSIVSNDYSTSNQPNKSRRQINIGDPIAVSGPIDLVSGWTKLRLDTSMRYEML